MHTGEYLSNVGTYPFQSVMGPLRNLAYSPGVELLRKATVGTYAFVSRE